MAEKTKIQKLCGCRDGYSWSGRWGAPRNLRWSLANFLSRTAHKLRGHKTYELGWGIEGNRAASLDHDIFITLTAGSYPLTLDEDDCDEIKAKARELAHLAHQTWWQPKL